MGNKVIFYSLHYLVISIIDNKMFFIGKRLENTYVININDIDYDVKCFSALVDSPYIWHRKLVMLIFN
jgi:hypothetical protein